MELRSLLHSMKVIRFFFPLTTVMGPLASFNVCFVYLLTRLLSNVLFPTPGGPTIATTTGGGSSSGYCHRSRWLPEYRTADNWTGRHLWRGRTLWAQREWHGHLQLECRRIGHNPWIGSRIIRDSTPEWVDSLHGTIYLDFDLAVGTLNYRLTGVANALYANSWVL